MPKLSINKQSVSMFFLIFILTLNIQIISAKTEVVFTNLKVDYNNLQKRENFRIAKGGRNMDIKDLLKIMNIMKNVNNKLELYCYPNPFVSQLVINYSVLNDADVIIEAYTYTGRLVGKIVDEFQPAGKYFVHWNASDNNELKTGLYIIKLSIDGHSAASRIMYVM